MRLIDGMPYTPACATDIRATFNKAMQCDSNDDWRCRVEGAKQVMHNIKLRPICRTLREE